MKAASSVPPSAGVLRSDLFEVAAAPRTWEGRPRLPRYVRPVEGEALISWLVRLSAALAIPPRALCRDAFGVDMRANGEWWRRPDPVSLDRIERWTGVGRDQLEKMTLNGWAASRDDEEAERFSARRWRGAAVSPVRARPVPVCPQCITHASRPYLGLTWMVGWVGACPQHALVLSDRCPSCGEGWRLRGLSDAGVVELIVCVDCGASLGQGGGARAHPAAIELQAMLLAGKRSGTTDIASIGPLDWPMTMALADVLLSMVWTRATKKQRDYLAPRRRDRLFSRIARDLRIGAQDRNNLPWTSNYGGLVILAWLLDDPAKRLPYAIATLCSPRLEGLLGREGLDDPTRERLRAILAPAAAKSPKGRQSWRPWLETLPLSAQDLQNQAARERYKHRRQRLTALAELLAGASVPAAAAKVGVRDKSVYCWLRAGAAGGLEAMLERAPSRHALTGLQREALGQWIAADRTHQTRTKVMAKARELFGLDLGADAASQLLQKHRRAQPGQRRRLWGPKHGPRS